MCNSTNQITEEKARESKIDTRSNIGTTYTNVLWMSTGQVEHPKGLP